jgi:hypothetical protein
MKSSRETRASEDPRLGYFAHVERSMDALMVLGGIKSEFKL